jgi:hypothetical protein
MLDVVCCFWMLLSGLPVRVAVSAHTNQPYPGGETAAGGGNPENG